MPDSPLRQRLRSFFELVSSMRFAIALLTVICIASVIGTVLQQHQPINNYVNQFGPFWSQLFLALKLNAVYSAWWFLIILAFLVISTSLCLTRHTPKYLADLRNFKEDIREKSLQAFNLKAQADLPESSQAAAQRIGQGLVQLGWRVKVQERTTANGTGFMVAAKKGAATKLGYIAAHTAIVLICLGGLLDGDLIVRAQMWLGGKTPFNGSGRISEVIDQHRLSVTNPTFRGNLPVAEGTQADTAILSQSDGVLLQPLPFSVELKKFIVEYYDTGMPKLFASEVILHDYETGEAIPKRIEVNHPASHRGIEIYQSSFDDGGSKIKLSAVPFSATTKPFEIHGIVGESTTLADFDGSPVTLEFTQLRTINVENFSNREGAAVDVRKVDLRSMLDSRTGAGHKTGTEKKLRNIGPSIGYKLRDSAGQAREYQNYMLPTDMEEEGNSVFLLGVRETEAEPFRYLRVPADPEGKMDTFLRLRLALLDPAQREAAVRSYANNATPTERPDLRDALAESALRIAILYAGTGNREKPDGGLQALGKYLEDSVPESERERASEVLLRILNGILFELTQQLRSQAQLPPLQVTPETQRFMAQAVFALSDAQYYPAPAAFMLEDFDQVQASVFQVARAPGKKVVYLGCFFLIVGIFGMLYVRDRRLWVWLAPQAEAAQNTHATMAMSCNRKLIDIDREFAQLNHQLLGAAAPTTAPTASEV